ncbi:hypothetical protein [Aeoliella sp. SH292]|uniref:hypothetical protein n=1 Tax=Aeoliella sp. SH292 TaxID=3454464 RepID=UPI003F975B03
MNCVYFACPQCHRYLDAGYRWAYWELEKPGVVLQGEPVNIDRVLATPGYWNVDDSLKSAWLRECVLPKVRNFLREHRDHSIRYVDEEWIYDQKELADSWREIQTWRKNSEPDEP